MSKKPKVVVAGAAGGIGQPLSMLLKLSPLVGDLGVVDVVGTEGMAADLSHINIPGAVLGHAPAADNPAPMRDADILVVLAGRAQKPGMSRDDLFNFNARIVESIAKQAAELCPNAMICIVSNPVNSLVPVFSEILKSRSCYDPRRVFGINTLDGVRARTFVAELKGLNVEEVTVHSVGGHSGPTILPLLSRTKPTVSFTEKEIEELTFKIQDAANVVINLKAGKGSSTLSIAYATYHFVSRLIEAMNGKEDVVETAYVRSDVIPDLTYLATPLQLGPSGTEKNLGLGELSEYERKRLTEVVVPELKANIKKAEEFCEAELSNHAQGDGTSQTTQK
jgi:malate dehydrogenase